MVALAVRFLGQRPVSCNSRPLLFRAHADLQRGALIEAGCRLREAVRLYVFAECEYQGCLPPKKQRQAASLLLKALHDSAPDFAADWLHEIIGYCNKLAHCEHVEQKRIETCISILHMYLDAAPYLQQPACCRMAAAEGGLQ